LMHYAKSQFLMLFLYLLIVLQECAQTGEVLAHGFHSAPRMCSHAVYKYSQPKSGNSSRGSRHRRR
jgi:hypothetical protein